jgi:hypothetical protein
MRRWDKIVAELNSELENRGLAFRYSLIYSASGEAFIYTTLSDIMYVDNFTIKPTRNFTDWLESWFRARNSELSYRNDGGILLRESSFDKY